MSRRNPFDTDDTRITEGFDRNAESWRRADKNVVPERPMRTRRLTELAGEHRGERQR